MSMRFVTAFLASVIFLPAALSAQEGLEEEYHKNIKVFQAKPILKKERVQLGVFGAASTNPGMMGHAGFGGEVDYHISELLAVGLQFTQFMMFPTDLKDEVEGTFGVFPERTELGYAGSARFWFTPLFGKFGVSFLPYWDASVFVGGGMVRSKASDFTAAGEAGVGLRFYLTKGLALTTELSDMVYRENFAFGTKDESQFMQNWMVRLGLSLYIPYSFSYSEVEQ